MKKHSNFMVVGFPVIWGYIDVYLSGRGGSYDNHFSREDLRRFFEEYCNRFLLSFANNYNKINNSTPEDYEKYNRTIAELFIKSRTGIIYESQDIEFTVDSGGYQVAAGRIDRQGMKHLKNMYHKFLIEYEPLYTRAFILDLPPSSRCVVFSNFDEVYKENLNSYIAAASLPDQVRNKLIYVHHMRTPKLMEVFTKILRENNLFSKFNHFATGGIASNPASDSRIPYFTYALPLVQLLNEAIKNERKEFSYHVLGGASLRDVFTYEFVKYHIQKKHGITVNITFDSTNSMNPWLGRPFPILDGKNVLLRGKSSQFTRVNSRETLIDKLNSELERFAKEVNFKKIEVTHREDGLWTYDTALYLLFYTMYVYKKIELKSIAMTRELYPIYESCDRSEFNFHIEKVFRSLNAGKITRKHNAKFHALGRTLDLLTTLDEDHLNHIVKTYLAHTEFSDLIDDKNILTV